MKPEIPRENDQNQTPILDREGNAVAGVGRLDQVIGAEAAELFFAERKETKEYLMRQAVKRWLPAGNGYSYSRRNRRTR